MADLGKWRREQGTPTLRPKDQPAAEVESPGLHPDEKRALYKIQREARQQGATLHSNGKGGLPPSLVLGVMRRDRFACTQCKGKADLQVHHQTKQGPAAQKNLPANIMTICHGCHDKAHDKANALGVDVSRVTRNQGTPVQRLKQAHAK